MEKLCDNAGEATKLIAESDGKSESISFLLRCNALIDAVREHLLYGKTVLFPYMKELAEKDNARHDCSNCAGACHLGHSARIVEITASHERVRQTLEELDEVLSVPNEDISADDWMVLRDELQLLQEALIGLFYLEEEVLIPKIKRAQKNINARD